MEEKKIVNLTKHVVNVQVTNENGTTDYVFEPSGMEARVSSKQETFMDVCGIPVVRTEYSSVEGLPAQEDGTIYIVSTLVLQALKANGMTRTDCVAPNTSPAGAIRNELGQVVAVKGFQTL